MSVCRCHPHRTSGDYTSGLKASPHSEKNTQVKSWSLLAKGASSPLSESPCVLSCHLTHMESRWPRASLQKNMSEPTVGLHGEQPGPGCAPTSSLL